MRFLRWLLTLGALTSAASACNWSGGSQGHDPVERLDATTIKVYADALENIRVSTATMMDFPDQLYVMGKVSVTEDRTDIVPARVSGRIDQIFFASGEHASKGQPLCSLFSPDFIAAKEEYLQALRQSRATGGKGDPSDFANLASLAKKKLETMGVSPRDIEALAASGAEAPGKPAMLLVRSPRSGVIIAKSAVLGNLVNVGDTLFMMGDFSKVWFLGDLYPEDLPKVHKNQEVRIAAPGENRTLTGKVSFISPIVDPNTRTIKIRALIDNPDGVLRGDMYVQGSVILNEAKALLVPTNSILRSSEGDSIFKRITPKTIENSEASVTFKKVAVRLGAERQGMTAVLDGLKEGEEVVSDGGLLLDAALNATENAK